MNRDLTLAGITFITVAALVMIMNGISAAFTAALMFMGMLLFVTWTKRQNEKDKQFIRRIVGCFTLLLALVCLVELLTCPVSALTMEYEFDGSQVIWKWYGGTPPYSVWDSNGLIAEGYPDDWMIRDVDPGRTYTLAVTDAGDGYAARTAKAPYYTYPPEIWLLLALFIGTMIVSVRIPYAAFGSVVIGGFLMLIVGANPDYVGYLRIIAISTFITGLGALYIHGGRG